jgi:ferritin-like metal-binding protein YciE
MSSQTATLGANRTGIATSKDAAQRMVEGTAEFPPETIADERAISDVRELFAKEADPLGSVPPPPTLAGIAATAVKAVKGARPTQFVDKLGERLAFERAGVRLYEALISKYNTYGSFAGGPSLAQLEENMLEEHSHFSVLSMVLERLGADPTAMTPSADLHATMTKGILEVMVEPRTSFVQCLEALLLVELADNECWESLIEMARQSGDDKVVEAFEHAFAQEAGHLEDVRAWLSAAQNLEAPDGA